MSIASEITRLQNNRNTIRDTLITWGVAESTDTLADLAATISGISKITGNTTLDTTTTSRALAAGYYDGTATVSITLETKTATPSTTAQTVTPTSGSVLSSVVVEAIETETKTVTPSTSSQDITPTTGKFLTKVTVNAIPSSYGDASNADVTAADILAGKTAIGYNSSTGAAIEIEGTMANQGKKTIVLDTSTTSYTIPAGYHNGQGTVSLTTQTKTVDPSTSSQTITPDSNKVLSEVTVAAMPEGALSKGAGHLTLTAGAGSVSAAGSGVGLTEVTQANVGSYYVTASGSGTVSGSGSGTVTVGTSGYIEEDTSETSDVASDSQSSNTATKYYNIATETKSVDPAVTAQTITPTANTLISSVTVTAMPAGALSKGAGSITLTAGSGSVSASGTGVTLTEVTQANVGDYYVTAQGSGSVSGTGSGTVSVGTAGYIAKNTSETSNTASDSKSSNTATKYFNVSTETKTADPADTAQDITPTTGSLLSKVTVGAITYSAAPVITLGYGTLSASTVKGRYNAGTNNISIGLGTGDNSLTAAAGHILNGYRAIGVNAAGTAVASVTGTMANNGAVNQTLTTSATSYTIPAGYHNGSGKVSISTQTKTATPGYSAVTVTPDSGKVLSSVTVEAITESDALTTAIVDGGAYIESAPGATVTDYGWKTTVTIPAGHWSTQQVITVDYPNIFPATESEGTSDKMLAGYKLYNAAGELIVGTMINRGAVSQTLTTSTTSYTIPAGYHNGSGTVSLTTQTKTVDPADTAQDITPDSTKVLSKVTVTPITYSAAPTITLGYGTLSASTAKGRYNAGSGNVTIGLGTGDNTLTGSAAQVLSGYRVIGVNAAGTAVASVTGTMANNGAVSQTLTTSSTSYTIPAGYHNGSGKVSISTQSKTVDPATTAQTVTPDTGKVLSSVTVSAMAAGALRAGAGSLTLTAGAGSVSSAGTGVTLTEVASDAVGDYYVTSTGSGSVSGTGSGTVSVGTAGYLAKDTSLSSNTASSSKSSNTATKYYNISTETKSVDPSDSSQTITPGTGKLISSVTVSAITYSAAPTVTLGYGTLSASTAKGRYNAGSGNVTIGLGSGDNKLTAAAAHILSGYRAIGVNAAGTAVASVTGTMANNGAVSQTLTTALTSYTVPAGYHNGSGTISISTQSKSVDPSTSAQTVNPDTGKVLSSVTVSAMPAGALSKGNGHLTLTAGAGSVSSAGTGVTLTEVAASGRGSYYVTSTGSGTVSGSGSGTVSVGTAGYLAKDTSETSNAATDSKSSNTATKYYNISTETKSIDPATTAQTVTPTTGTLISSVTVSAMPAGALSSGAGSITLTAGAGSVSSTGTGVTLTEVAASGRGSYYVTSTGSGTVSGSGSGTVSVGTAGYLAKNTSKSSNAATDSKSSNTATKYYNISTETKTVDPATTAKTVSASTGKLMTSVTVSAMPAGALSKGDGSLSLTAGAGSVSASGTGVTISEVAAANVGSYYVTATGSGTVSGSGSGTVSVGTAGYLAKNTSLSSNAATGSKSSNTATKYYNISTETKTADPADTAQTINASTGKLISSVTVSAITYSAAPTVTLGYGTLSASTSKGRYNAGSGNITIGLGSGNNTLTGAAAHVLSGKRVIGVNAAGTAVASVEGTMANNGATGTTLTTNGSSYTIPAGYTSGGTVTVSIPNLVSSTVSNNFTSYQEFTANSPVTASTSVASAPTAGSIRVTGGIAATSGIIGSQVYNAVWNDLADAIPVDDACELEYGYCYCFDGEHYYKSSKYLDDGIIGIHSDTAGFVMGTKGEGKEMQVAVAGFVLAYVDKEYKPGTLLTCTENGHLTEISKQDKIENPEKVIASFWKPETKENWGSPERQVKVNGRMWVKVR